MPDETATRGNMFEQQCIRRLEELQILSHIPAPTIEWVCLQIVGKEFVYQSEPGTSDEASIVAGLITSLELTTSSVLAQPLICLYVSKGPIERFELPGGEYLWSAYHHGDSRRHSVGQLRIV